MLRQLIYNGGTVSYGSCSSPKQLQVGKAYKIIGIKEYRFQTNYVLAGVLGEFNSVWFDDLPPIYVAVCSTKPVVGSFLQNFTRYNNGRWESVNRSSYIKEIKEESSDLFVVHTLNAIYGTYVIDTSQDLTNDICPIYKAVCSTTPVIGSFLENFSRYEDGRWKSFKHSSRILDVFEIYPGLYQVRTKNTVYIVYVINPK